MSSKPLKVLLVDDDPVSSLVVKAALQQLDFDVTSVSGGAEAVSSMLWGRFDLVVTDLIMPKVDGWEVIRYARETQKKAKIVAISGGMARKLAPSRALEVAELVGADLTLTKPVDARDLQAEIRELMKDVASSVDAA